MTTVRRNRERTMSAIGVLALLAAAALLPACGGGGGGAAPGAQLPPPGGGPRPVAQGLSSGMFLGQGSVIVNGVEFSTPATAIMTINDVDVSAQGDAAFRIGMILKVRGTFGPSTLTGTAQSVEVEPQVIGLVTNPTGTGFTVLGQSVTVTPFTIFEGASNPPTGAVEVHGSFTGPNAIEATFIRPSTVATVQLRGIVDGVIGTTLSIGAQQVGFAGVTPAPIVAAGNFVEVEGTVVGGAIQATKVEIENLAVEAAGLEVEAEGSVAAAPAGSTFTLRTASGPVTVSFGAGTRFELEDNSLTTSAILTADAQVEVEGNMVGGVLQATEIELERKENVVLEGDVTNGTLFGLTLSQVLTNGTHVEVGGFVPPGGTTVTVTRVATLPASTNLVLQGPAANVNAANNTFSILGIAIDLTGLQERDDPVLGLTSEFENAANVRITRTNFLSLLQSNPTVVKANAQASAVNPPFNAGVFNARSGVELEEPR